MTDTILVSIALDAAGEGGYRPTPISFHVGLDLFVESDQRTTVAVAMAVSGRIEKGPRLGGQVAPTTNLPACGALW